MPELLFKGKQFVFNHHLAVPHRPLVPYAGRSVGVLYPDSFLCLVRTFFPIVILTFQMTPLLP